MGQWRRSGEPINSSVQLHRDQLHPFLYATLNAAPSDLRPVISWKSRHTTWAQSHRQSTNWELTKLLRGRKTNLIVCPISGTSTLLVSLFLFLLNRSPPRDGVGEGRRLAKLMLVSTLVGNSVVCFFPKKTYFDSIASDLTKTHVLWQKCSYLLSIV